LPDGEQLLQVFISIHHSQGYIFNNNFRSFFKFQFKGGSVSNVLLKADVTIQDNSVCTSQYGSGFIGNDMMCASAPGTDTCQVGTTSNK
jgi:hypothetical protein